MTKTPDHALQKRLNVGPGTAEAIPVERARWERLKRRVQNLDERWSLSWISNVASVVFTLTTSAFFAALAIPTGERTGIDPVVKPLLFFAAAAGLVVTLIFAVFYFVERRSRRHERSDIVDEMEAEESAWLTARAARGSGG